MRRAALLPSGPLLLGVVLNGVSWRAVELAVSRGHMPFWRSLTADTFAVSLGLAPAPATVGATAYGPSASPLPATSVPALASIVLAEPPTGHGVYSFQSAPKTARPSVADTVLSSDDALLRWSRSVGARHAVSSRLLDADPASLLESLRRHRSRRALLVVDQESVGRFGGPEQLAEHLASVDRWLARLWAEGREVVAALGVTADHGVSEKCAVVDVGSRVAEALPDLRVRRIVDPMAEDRGMKEFPGAFVGLEFEDLMDEEKTRRAVKAIRSIPGVYAAIGREDALRELEMHADADCGDVVVLADASTAFSTVHTGKKVAYSYGGFDDQCVPFMLVVPPNGKKIPVEVTAKITKGNMRNYDLWPALIQCAEQTNKPT